MGVPGFFAWILKNFKNEILLKKLQQRPKYLYIDANCLFHPECFKILDYFPNENNLDELEKKMFDRILNYLNYLENIVNPTDMMYVAVDGTAPLAKIGQQRKRRFKSMHDTKIRNEIKIKHKKQINDCWNNTVITPGTEFMEKLHNRIIKHYEFRKKKSKIQYVYSSYHTPGEGEHKILQHIKNNCLDDDNIVVYGLDADLIFLALASGKKSIFLLREATHFGLKDTNENNNELFDPISDVAQELVFVSISETKKAYNREIWNTVSKRNNLVLKFDESTDFSNDLICLCFLLGNDFLPHFPSIDIHRGGLDTIVDCYIYCISRSCQLLLSFDNNIVNINTVLLLMIIEELGNLEEKHFQYELPKHIESFKRRRCYANDEFAREIWEMENLKGISVYDPVRLGSGSIEEWKFRYYCHYFHTSEHQEEFIDHICETYLEGIMWVTNYYFHKCNDWQYQYPYNNAPFISDVGLYMKKTKLDINKIIFHEKKPIKTMAQLVSVLPPSCSELLPKKYRQLVTQKSSPIIDMFPKTISLDILYKDQYWQCIPKIPFLDVSRVIEAVDKLPLNDKEKTRNKILNDFLFII